MNLKAIEERKKELLTILEGRKAEREQLMQGLKQNEANIQSVNGALLDCDYWLGEMSKIATPVMEVVEEK